MKSLALLALLSLSGCQVLGWAAHGVAGAEKKVWHDAQYEGLAHQSVAVLTSADEFVLHRNPSVTLDVSRAVAADLAERVPGVRLADPQQVHEFTQKNPYWNTLPYGELLKKLSVQRIVHMDLVQYTLHEPGNQHVWRGVAVSNVNVAAADAPDPNNLLYTNTLKVVFPPDRAVGVLDADDRTIHLGLLVLLGDETAKLFYRHQKTQE